MSWLVAAFQTHSKLSTKDNIIPFWEIVNYFFLILQIFLIKLGWFIIKYDLSKSNQLNAGIRELSGYSSSFARAGAIEDEETAHNMATAVFDTYVQENESYRITFQMKCDHGRNRKCDPDEFSFKISKTISK